jgi:serine/threonine protein kinase
VFLARLQQAYDMAGPGNRVISVGDVFQERYEVLAKLSEGGFGEVFQARQLTTGQLVALKTLRQQHFDYSENQLARFRREVKLCATLHHPHIVGLIDFGATASGLLYIVFEFVPGRTLADLLASEGNLPVLMIMMFPGLRSRWMIPA